MRRNAGRPGSRDQRAAAKLLPTPHRAMHVGCCLLSYGVDVINNTQEGRARFGLADLRVCLACPCCSGTVSEQRRRELNALLAWARKQGLHPVMLTLTARHSVDHRLAELLDGMKNAKRRLTTHRTFAKLLRPQLVGYVTATEVTGGGFNGWHPHFHQVMLVRAGSQAEALDLVESCASRGSPPFVPKGSTVPGPRSRCRAQPLRATTLANGAPPKSCPVGQEVGRAGAALSSCWPTTPTRTTPGREPCLRSSLACSRVAANWCGRPA